jgi:hypothetical protein
MINVNCCVARARSRGDQVSTMDGSHMAILLVVLMATYIQGTDMTLKPGMIKELYGN